jgi:serine phosphatase RsbU (regulator of sigma subunit)
MAPSPILIAAASRPHPTETINGDVWHVDWHATGCRIAVIDGLGHGPAAADAASRARDTLARAPDADPVEALRLCHDALRGTRGAAMSTVTIDLTINRLVYAGIGNVETHLTMDGQTVRLPSMRGIVGSVLPTVRSFSEPLLPGWILLIHSDGIKDRFRLDELLVSGPADAQGLADTILAQWSRLTDDATVVVASASRPLAASR